MMKLVKYIKPYLSMIVLCIALLFVQALSELNLPNLMSDIVNVGIQRGGVEEGAPEAFPADTMETLRFFMTDADKQILEASYELVPAGSGDTAKYPASAEEDIYVLKSTDKEALANAQGAYDRAVGTMMNLRTLMAGESQTGDSSQSGNADIGQMSAMLANIPQETMAKAQEMTAQTDASSLSQYGASMTKELYEQLGMDLESVRNAYMFSTGAKMLLLTLLSALAAIGVGYISARTAAGVSRSLRRDVFRRVEDFSNAEFDNFSTASLITRSTNDVMQVQMLLMMGLRILCYAPIMGVGGVVMAVRKSISMTWIIAIGVILLIGLMAVIFSAVMPRFKVAQKLVDRLNLVTRENLSGMMVIRAFGTQKFEEERFDKSNRDLTGNQLYINRVMAVMMPAMMFLMNAVQLLIMWVGAQQIEQSAMQVGDMMAFMQYAMQIIMSFLMISMMFIMVPRASVSGERIAEVLGTKPSVRDPEQPSTLGARAKGVIEFKNVSFRYNNAEDDVLQDISFVAKPGETTAFIGSTGSGKSTLINLIPRFYDTTEGKVTVDGVNVRNLTMEELRKNIGYVPQKGVLFSGDIASNIRYGSPDATGTDVEKSAEIAQATEFISSSPHGLETDISQGGSNVSGGQKQRLAIARALTKKASIYIFDDSFSALDFKTDAALRRALKEYTGDSAVLIVAQRVSTIMQAEQIIVLDEGRIVGKGTHKELLANCPVYREIAESQLSKEELE